MKMETTRKTSLLTTLTLGATLLFTAAASAAPEGFGLGFAKDAEFGAERIAMMADRLDLDEAQVAQIEAIVDANRAQAESLKDAFADNRAALQEAAAFDQYDAAAVAELADDLGALTSQRVLLKTQVRNEVLAVLTEEQRADLGELRQRRADRMQRRADRRRSRGDG